MSRILLFTGKGGVGKTTIAAATAVCAAKHGYKTVVMSTDAAHSLGDSLDCQLGPEPLLISPNLWAQESNILYNIEKYWGTVKKWLAALMAWRGVDEIVAEEIAVLPGMEELANLLWVYYHQQEGKYDVIVIDCAPTGESLRLLTFPEVAQWISRSLVRNDPGQLFVMAGLFGVPSAAILHYLNGPRNLLIIILGITAVMLVIALVNMIYRASFHLAMVTSMLTALWFFFGAVSLIGFLLVPILGLSRYRLGEHTPAQIATGFFIGLIVSLAVFSGFGLGV